jgi:hypothetical protein
MPMTTFMEWTPTGRDHRRMTDVTPLWDIHVSRVRA